MSCFVGHPVQYTLITSNKLNRKTTLLQFFDVGTKKIILFSTYQITNLVIFFLHCTVDVAHAQWTF